ncbi:MAG: hypothetical protein JXX28_08840 [Deltaproteobacteria bacterium]|nr:hypothetical protein [Deltaproteobacteria bacterium]
MSQEALGNEPVYEMLWDCPGCGTEGLLGVTHRYCPNCGSAQDPGKRYFPPEDEKVAVQDHQYFGADWVCPGCDTPNSAASTYCSSCGGTADGAKAAKRVSDTPPPVAEPARGGGAVKAAAGAGGCLVMGVIGVIVAVILFFIVGTFFTSKDAMTVSGHSWTRTVAVEEFKEVSDKGWCEQMPAGARETSRSMKEKGTEKVADGETCVKKNKDLGDGTFKQVEECKPKFKDVAVEAAWCKWDARKWDKVREEKAAGAALSPAPTWPAVKLTRGGCAELGCQREGARAERYEVSLQDDKGKSHVCDLPEKQWSGMALRSRWTVDVTLTGGLQCGSLAPEKR